MNPKIRVAIVDDHPLFRQGVANTLQARMDMEIVGQGSNAREALELARSTLPDIILLDITMPGGGLEAARSIAAACPVTKIIMLTVSEEEEDVLEAFRAGARAYILKGVSARELVHILRSVHAGEVYINPNLAANLLLDMKAAKRAQGGPRRGSAPKGTSTQPPLDELTERERQILELVASGCSNREIGGRLYLSEKTVKHYMTNILQKLHVRNRVQAALLAHDAGISGPGIGSG